MTASNIDFTAQNAAITQPCSFLEKFAHLPTALTSLGCEISLRMPQVLSAITARPVGLIFICHAIPFVYLPS